MCLFVLVYCRRGQGVITVYTPVVVVVIYLLICLFVCASVLSAGSGFEVGGVGEEVDTISLRPFSDAAVVGGVKRYIHTPLQEKYFKFLMFFCLVCVLVCLVWVGSWWLPRDTGCFIG